MKQIVNQSISLEELKRTALIIIDEAKKRGATEAEVSLASNHGFTVAVRQGSVETLEYHQDKVVDIDVYFGKRSGSASLTDLRLEPIQKAVEAACHIAKFTGVDEANGLADLSELAFHYPELELAFPYDISVDEAIQLGIECEREALSLDPRIMSSEEVTFSTMQAKHVYANSLGFCGAYPYSRHDLSCVLIGKKGDEMQRDYYYTVATDPSLLATPKSVAKEAAKRTISRLGARTLPTMKAPVIFVAEEARGLLGHFLAAIAGGAIYRRASFLTDKVGQTIFPHFFHLQEQPHLAKALGSAPFDEDGVRTRNNIFVENGILTQYAMGVYSARKLGMKSTGNAGGYHNITVKTSDDNLTQLLKTMDRGLLITETMGNGVNMITGDYSRGVGGYWVEKGEIQYPVHEVTVASTLQDMYARIVRVGNDVDKRGNVLTGSILIEEMMIAGG